MKNKVLYSVQYLRGLAALLVVICHAIGFRNIAGVTQHPTSSSIEFFGAIGVDIFFVISGFIITYTSGTATGSQAASVFARKRFIRIVPVYYIASGLYLARYVASQVFSFIPPPHVAIGKLTLLKTVTILPVFDKGVSLPTVLTLAWTLSYELLFYIIFTLLILFKVQKREQWLLAVILGLVACGACLPTRNIQWEFATNYMILEFASGVAFCMLYQRLETVSVRIAGALISLAVLMFAGLILSGRNQEIAAYGLELAGPLPLRRALLWGFPSALFVAGVVFLEKSKAIAKPRQLMLLLGDASYSVYLTHGLVFMAIGMLLNHFTALKHMQQELFLVMSVVLAVAGGVCFYTWIEKPLLRWLHHAFVVKRKPVLNTNQR